MHKDQPIIIAIDYDGTIVELEEHPQLKTDFVFRAHAKEVLQWAYQHFYTILWTCRADVPLIHALKFLERHDVKFHAVNENASFLDFKTSKKIFADKYIDDRAGSIIDWLQVKSDLTREFLPFDDEMMIGLVTIEALC